jgi:hypothetical protein
MKQAVRRKHHYIYKITRVDGKYYIGMHSTDNLEDNYFGSGTLLSKSIKKHGKDKHIKEILEHLPTREALKLRETEIVNEELLGDKMCMNLTLGGGGGWHHINIPGAWKGKSNFAANNVANSKKFHEKLEADPDRKKEWAAKISKSLTGKPKWSNGTTGKSFKKKPGSAVGKSNSQFGTCWVTKETSIKINLLDLERYLADGFVRGRKIKGSV